MGKRMNMLGLLALVFLLMLIPPVDYAIEQGVRKRRPREKASAEYEVAERSSA